MLVGRFPTGSNPSPPPRCCRHTGLNVKRSRGSRETPPGREASTIFFAVLQIRIYSWLEPESIIWLIMIHIQCQNGALGSQETAPGGEASKLVFFTVLQIRIHIWLEPEFVLGLICSMMNVKKGPMEYERPPGGEASKLLFFTVLQIRIHSWLEPESVIWLIWSLLNVKTDPWDSVGIRQSYFFLSVTYHTNPMHTQTFEHGFVSGWIHYPDSYPGKKKGAFGVV